MPIVIETLAEWIFKHETRGKGVFVEKLQKTVFADGAMVNQEGTQREEPPSDPYKLLEARRTYHTELVRRAESRFKDARTKFSDTAAQAHKYANLPGPPAGAVAILRGLRKYAHLKRAELAGIMAQLRQTPRYKAIDARLKREEMRREHYQNLNNAIISTTLDNNDNPIGEALAETNAALAAMGLPTYEEMSRAILVAEHKRLTQGETDRRMKAEVERLHEVELALEAEPV